MQLFKQILTNNNCYKVGAKLNVKGVLWHSTGANNPYISRYVQPDDGNLGKNKYGNHWNQPLPDGKQICVHAFIGKCTNGAVATYQTLPWDMRGWHAGGKANDTHIAFEICEDNLKDIDYFNAIYKEACELTAYLCKIFKLDPLEDGVVICHKEAHARGLASNHGDVMHWFDKYGKTMDDVRNDVNALMGNSAPAPNVLYRVQCGAFTKVANANNFAKVLKDKGYSAFVVKVDGIYKVQCGAFSHKKNAEALSAQLKKDGYNNYITAVSIPAKTISVGDKVRIKNGATAYDGTPMKSYVYSGVYTVDQLKGTRALLDSRGLCTAFNIADLIKV